MKFPGSILCLLTWFTLVAVGYSDSECDTHFAEYPREPVIPAIGSEHTVVCRPHRLAFEWFKGRSALTGGSGVIANNGCDCSISSPLNTNLTFRSFRPVDAGNYSCRVTLGTGSFRICNFEVLVPEIPTVSLPSPSETVSSGELVITPTISFGRPRGTIEWRYENAPLQSSSEIIIDSMTGKLTFTNVQSNHRGLYTIRVFNEHGSNSANYSLTVYFLDQPTLVVQDNVLVCTVLGFWDTPPEFNWNPLPRATDRVEQSMVLNSTTLRAREATGEVECLLYECIVSNRGMTRRSERNRFCRGPTVTPIGNTRVTVTWDVIENVMAYHIRYGLVGQSNEQKLVTASLTDTTLEISGLMAGRMYEFELGTVESLSTIVYSGPTPLTLGLCTTATPTVPARNVRAGLHSQDGRKTVRVTWDASSESVVTGYRVSVSTSPPQSIVVTGTSFTLDSDYCNGTYQYTVEPVNECNIGSNPRTVTFTCANLIQISTVKTSGQTFTFRIDGNFSAFKMPMNIVVSTILPQENDITITNTYEVQTFMPTVCVSSLQSNTYYNICLCVESQVVGGGEQKFCIQQKTGSNPESVSSCLEPTQTSTFKIEGGPSPAGFPDWAIAVIVVGCLAVIALGFCFVGVYYACSSNKSKDYIYGSTPSLQASSVNMSGMHNAHRSTSPPRSCLSYHHSNGHSTNWNEHRNTLRQMETEKGTHV